MTVLAPRTASLLASSHTASCGSREAAAPVINLLILQVPIGSFGNDSHQPGTLPMSIRRPAMFYQLERLLWISFMLLTIIAVWLFPSNLFG